MIMAHMKDLAKLVKELEDQIVVCMRCGMCQAVCPLFAQTGREADVARGKLALLEGLSRELFESPDSVNERINRCLLCGSCAANCPSGVNVIEIFIKARAILTGFMGLSPLKKLIFRGMLSHPKFMDALLDWAKKFQNVLTKPVNEVLGTSCARIESSIIGNRHFKTLAPTPFHQTSSAHLNTSRGKSGFRVVFFVGCLIDKIFPQIAHATVDVLMYHGVGIYVLPHQGCCGIPALSSGDMATYNKLVRYTVENLHGVDFDYVVTACATCTSTIHKLWPSITSSNISDLSDRIRTIAEKTMDINQFLVSKIGIRPSDIQPNGSIPVTYHDPCHLKKSLKVVREPRIVIQANPSYCLKEMQESDTCCGLGGSFNLMHYDLSQKIGTLKRSHIQSTGCHIVATGCPACMIQISDMLSKAGDRIQVKHPIEIYAEAIRTYAN